MGVAGAPPGVPGFPGVAEGAALGSTLGASGSTSTRFAAGVSCQANCTVNAVRSILRPVSASPSSFMTLLVVPPVFFPLPGVGDFFALMAASSAAAPWPSG